MTTSDWVIAAATLLGPVFAVQAQKWIERIRERRMQKERVFLTLMATRAARLTPDHVRALNAIDIAFYGSSWAGRSDTEKGVLGKWKEYLDDLCTPWPTTGSTDLLVARRDTLFGELLAAIAKDLDYDFDTIQLRKGGYTPQAHGDEWMDNVRFRQLAIKVLSGEQALKVDGPRPDPEFIGKLREVQQKMGEALDGKRALRVEMKRRQGIPTNE